MVNLRAIIPVAGIGTRLRPHTYTLPKVLLNVAGKPIIEHIMDKVTSEGIQKATFILGYLGEMVEEFIRNHYKIQCDFIYQEERKGLGHAVHLARDTFGNDELLIILGDTIFDVDLRVMLNSKFSTLGVKEVTNPKRFGVAVVQNGTITQLIEKPETKISNLAIVGLYYIKNPKLLEKCLDKLISSHTLTKGEYQLTDALELMIQSGEKFKPFTVDGWYDCGKPETLLATNHHLLKMLKKINEVPGIQIIPPVFISPKSKITTSIIGPYSTINDGAEISNSIIKNSIIGYKAKVENSLLHDSIIGNNSVIKGQYKKLNTGDSSEIEFY
jgi:glucose-1-phosphate thymidylyltransferase